MPSRASINKVVGVVLALGGLVFITLLAGVGSAQLTEDPPEVSPYQIDSASPYEYGSPATTSPVAAPIAPIPEYEYGSAATTSPVAAPVAPTSKEVVIKDFSFAPAELVVAAGTTVTFVNRENGVAHTSTSDDGAWKSGNLNPDDTFSFTFEEPGTFSYFCSIHPGMKAVITVEG